VRIVVRMPAGTTQARLQQLADAIAVLTGGAVEVLPEDAGAKSDPRGLRVQPGGLEVEGAPRPFNLVNRLALNVADLSELEAALVMTLGGCQGVFTGSKELFAALEASYPCWKGQGHRVRRVYADLRKRLSRTRYPLVAGRGVYGFEWLAKHQSGEFPLEVSINERREEAS
jgi:hypothetical protein